MEYKTIIVEILEKINNEEFLMRIYISLRDYLKEEKEKSE